MSRFASIDMGTQTFRLLIVDQSQETAFKTVYSENRIIRLGEGFSEEKRIRPPAIARAISALVHFKNILKTKRVKHLIVTATSAVREAVNRADFIQQVQVKTGFSVEVLSGEEEARCTLLGVNLIFKNRQKNSEAAPMPEPMLVQKQMVVIDIGGGSTEFMGSEKGVPTFLISTDLGAVTLTEKYLQSDPPTDAEMAQINQVIASKLDAIAHHFPSRCRFVGTAGTVTTLAAMEQQMLHYQPDKINHYRLTRDAVKRRLKLLSRLPLAKRRGIPGLERGREDILIAGTLILLGVMSRFGYDHLYVSDYGLREGVLVDRLMN